MGGGGICKLVQVLKVESEPKHPGKFPCDMNLWGPVADKPCAQWLQINPGTALWWKAATKGENIIIIIIICLTKQTQWKCRPVTPLAPSLSLMCGFCTGFRMNVDLACRALYRTDHVDTCAFFFSDMKWFIQKIETREERRVIAEYLHLKRPVYPDQTELEGAEREREMEERNENAVFDSTHFSVIYTLWACTHNSGLFNLKWSVAFPSHTLTPQVILQLALDSRIPWTTTLICW